MLQQKFYALVITTLSLLPVQMNLIQAPQGDIVRLNSAQEMPDANAHLEIIRQRVIIDLLHARVDEVEIRRLTKTIKPDGSWPGIDYQDVSLTGFQHAKHLENLYALARAYKKTGSSFYQNPEVRDVVFSALDFWLERDFICENWWWNEMGTPGRMINILLVLDRDLTEEQMSKGVRIAGRANLEASGARPGGDLIQIAGMLGKQALLRRDETVLERVISVMADEIKVTTGRGLKPDMSFHHRVDNVICTLSYGLGYANAFSYWAVKIAGTKYKFPEHSIRLLTDYFLDGICKSMVYGKFPDPGAKNRDLSRKGTLNPAGPGIAENLLRATNYRSAELKMIAQIRKDEITRPELTSNRFFWHSEYFSHQRPDFFASVRMHSSRNHTMEQPHNEEGLKMHHVGDGSNFISRSGEEYLDIFPVWDWQKIPGTTVVQKPVHPHWSEIARKGRTDFVGGVSDGKYGAAAFDFKSAHDPLAARKAWFFFDEEYVCLGAGISATAEQPVFTTLNQCLLNSDVIVRTKRETTTLQKSTHALSNVLWVFHDGIGYVFPEQQRVNISNTTATGSWKEINHQAGTSASPEEREVFTVWIDHGIKPEQGQYQYIVVPTSDKGKLERHIKNSPIDILKNTPQIQAARHRDLNRSQIVFYEPGKIKLDDNIYISAESPCMVMVKTNGKSLEQLVVSDPTRKMDNLQLKTSVMTEGSGEGWQSSWDRKEKESVIQINLPTEGYAGESVIVTFPVSQ